MCDLCGQPEIASAWCNGMPKKGGRKPSPVEAEPNRAGETNRSIRTENAKRQPNRNGDRKG